MVVLVCLGRVGRVDEYHLICGHAGDLSRDCHRRVIFCVGAFDARRSLGKVASKRSVPIVQISGTQATNATKHASSAIVSRMPCARDSSAANTPADVITRAEALI